MGIAGKEGAGSMRMAASDSRKIKLWPARWGSKGRLSPVGILLLSAGALLVVLLAAVLLTAWKADSGGKSGDGAVAVYINGVPVTRQEFAAFMVRKRSAVFAYFQQKDQAKDTPDFWTRSFDGERPINKLKSEALQDLITVKIQQIMAKQAGLVQDISYAAFLKDWKKENQRRKAALSRHEVIYGPPQYSRSEYFDIRFSDMVSGLIRNISRHMQISDEQLKQYYDRHIGSYTTPGARTIEKASISYKGQGAVTKADALEKLEQMKAGLRKGADFAKLAEDEARTSGIRIDFGQMTLDSQSMKSGMMLQPALTEAARRLRSLHDDAIVEGKSAVYLIQLIKKNKDKIVPFGEAKASIRHAKAEREYRRKVENGIKTAAVKPVQSVFDRISVRDLDK